MSDFIRINVAFGLPKEVFQEAVGLSNEVSNEGTTIFILDGVEFYPHITIYSPEYPRKNVDNVLSTVKEVVQTLSPVKFEFEKVKGSQGYVGIGFKLTEVIKDMHKLIVDRLNPLREGHLREKYKEGSDYHIDFSEEQKMNIKQYGYSNAMSLYTPHLTIIRFQDENLAKRVINNLNWSISSFVNDKLAVYSMGKHGTCRKLLKEFKMNNL